MIKKNSQLCIVDFQMKFLHLKNALIAHLIFKKQFKKSKNKKISAFRNKDKLNTVPTY